VPRRKISWLEDVALVLAGYLLLFLIAWLPTLSSQICSLFSPIFEEQKFIIFLFKLQHLLKIQVLAFPILQEVQHMSWLQMSMSAY